MSHRPDALARLETALEENPVTALLGPRQCGKTTLANMLAKRDGGHWFDLESAEDRAARDRSLGKGAGPMRKVLAAHRVLAGAHLSAAREYYRGNREEIDGLIAENAAA